MRNILFVLFVGFAVCRAFLTAKSPLRLVKKCALPPFSHPFKIQPASGALRSAPISIDRTVLIPLMTYDWKVVYSFSLTFAAGILCLSNLDLTENPEVPLASTTTLSRSKSISLTTYLERFKHVLLGLFPSILKSLPSQRRQERLNMSGWNACKLTKVERISEEYNRYSFDSKSNLCFQQDLDIAQELLLCAVDAKGRPLKSGFFLASPPASNGHFDIICRSCADLTGGVGLPLELQFMEVGDELAVKPGSRRLVYPGGNDADISALSVLTSGLGILPTLQLLREVLADPQSSSVQQVDVVWINDAKKDFILNEELAALERKYGEAKGVSGRLRVTRVVDREAGNSNTLLNQELERAVAPYRHGRVAIVMAEGAVAAKASRLFGSLGYPLEAVAALTDSSCAQ